MMAFSNTTGGKLEATFLNGEIQSFQINRQPSSFFLLDLCTHEENHEEWRQSFLAECHKNTDRTGVIASHVDEDSHHFIVCQVEPQDLKKPCKLTVTLKKADPKASSVIQSKRV
ncbi:hypothetical protein AOX56_13455 [Aeromonas sobria]|uniref:Uncharacterized protein n=1 Tax=Aeromonas sobria TaxID=646 RepID=A0A2N3J1L7_AERSO|nr:hypothetical protein [Aeromonas sobria]PKQ79581.1 hypothetical protein AOX56_13455 [Aeromonas sobria]